MSIRNTKINNYIREKGLPSKYTIAEYTYYKKENGKVKECKFKSKYISTIDTPYNKYVLKKY